MADGCDYWPDDFDADATTAAASIATVSTYGEPEPSLWARIVAWVVRHV